MHACADTCLPQQQYACSTLFWFMNGAGGVAPPCSWGMASEPQQSRRARLLALAALPAGRAGALASPQCTPPQSRRLQLLAAFRGDAAGSLSVPTGGVPAPSNGPAAGAAADPSRSRRGALAAAKSKKVARPSLLARRGQKRKASPSGKNVRREGTSVSSIRARAATDSRPPGPRSLVEAFGICKHYLAMGERCLGKRTSLQKLAA